MRKAKAPARWWAEVEMQVQFFDLDPMQIVWHGNYVKYLEVARCALLDKIGYNYEQMRESGYMWPIIEMNLRYAALAEFGQRLVLRREDRPLLVLGAAVQADQRRAEVLEVAGRPVQPAGQRDRDRGCDDVAGQNPGDRVRRRAQRRLHVRQRNVGDRRIQDLHDRRRHDANREQRAVGGMECRLFGPGHGAAISERRQ